MKTFRIIAGLVITAASLQATVNTADSQNRFERLLKKSKYHVVMFYEQDRNTAKDKDITQQIEDIKRMFRATSDTPFYKQANLVFISVNVAKDGGQDIASLYSIPEIPSFTLLDRGRPVKGSGDKAVLLRGVVNRQQLSRFINDNLQDSLQGYIDDMQEARERAREERAVYGGPSFSIGIGYPGYGYYGYPGYWGPGYWGPYYGGYWGRPGWSVGFGW